MTVTSWTRLFETTPRRSSSKRQIRILVHPWLVAAVPGLLASSGLLMDCSVFGFNERTVSLARRNGTFPSVMSIRSTLPVTMSLTICEILMNESVGDVVESFDKQRLNRDDGRYILDSHHV